MFCPECGKKISDNSKFCGQCGAAIKASESEAAQNIKIKTVTYNSQTTNSAEKTFGLREYLYWKFGREKAAPEGVLNTVLDRIKNLKNSKNAETLTEQAKDFEYTVLVPLEKQAVNEVSEVFDIQPGSGIEQTAGFTFKQLYRTFFELIIIRNQNYTLEDLKDQMTKKLIKDFIRFNYVKSVIESKEKLNNLFEQYPKNRYSGSLISGIEELDTHHVMITIQNTNSLASDDCCLTADEGREFVAFYELILQLTQQVESEQKDIRSFNDELTGRVEKLKERIRTLKEQICSIYYYSKNFREMFSSAESSLLQPFTAMNVSAENLNETLDNAEKNTAMLENMYQTEKEDAENRYQHNKQLAENMTEKLEEVLQSENDVKYSHSVTTMTDDIRKLISSYDRSGTELNVSFIEKKIYKLSEKRKMERNSVMNTIQMYESEIQRLKDYSVIYKKPGSDKLVNAFLKRRGLKG